MNPGDALLFLDLDRRSKQDEGTLFDEPRRRLSGDPALRAAWAQYQALRALAWECAPEPGERMIRHALQQTRRERVQGQLARTAGGDDLAREILLGRTRQRAGVPAWVWLLLLIASLGLGAMAWHQGLIGPEQANGPAPSAKPGDDAVSFEFPAQTAPADAALSAPSNLSGPAAEEDSEDVKHEDRASRQARLLLREELHQAETRANPRATPAQGDGQTTALQAALLSPAPPDVVQAEERALAGPGPASAPPRPKAAPAPTALPTKAAAAAPAQDTIEFDPAAATAAPTAAPATAPATAQAAPVVASTPGPAAAPDAAQPGMVLDSSDIVVGGRLRATLTLPEAKAVDLRLFDVGGKPVRAIADGPAGPGTVIYNVDAKDDNGQALPAGTYYLRVMTAWFSRVEPIQIH